MNQCDGCRRGLPVENGVHRGPGEGGTGDLQACTADRYPPDSVDKLIDQLRESLDRRCLADQEELTVDEYERHLHEQLAALQREYQERAKPIIDQLVSIKMLRPPEPIFVSQTDLPKAVLEQILAWSAPNTAEGAR